MHLIKVVLSHAITKTSDSWMDEERKTEVLDWLDWHEEEVVHLQNIWNEQIPNLIVLTSLTCNITINKMIRMKYFTQYDFIFVVIKSTNLYHFKIIFQKGMIEITFFHAWN